MSFEELSPWFNSALFVVAAVAVWIAGTKLARYADAIAEQTSIGRELLGLLLLGGITSLPELAVAMTATWRGVPELSIADVLGSASVNLVILAIADAISGRRAITSVQSSPGVMLQGVLSILLFAIVTIPMIAGDTLLFGAGMTSWTMLAVYLLALRLIAKSNATRAWKAHDAPRPRRAEHDDEHGTKRQLMVKTTLAACVILVAGFLLARTGESLAEQTGLGTGFFGIVFLAFATSLPEWSTVISAVRIRRYEMAISDIFGTNLFNVSIVAMVDLAHPGEPILLAAGPFAAFGGLLALALTTLFIVGLLERRDRTVLRMGWDSFAVLLGYCGGIVVLHGLS